MTSSLPDIFHGDDDFETVIDLSHQEKTNVRGDLGALEIYLEGPVSIRSDHLFLAFTTGSPPGPPDLLFIPPYIKSLGYFPSFPAEPEPHATPE